MSTTPFPGIAFYTGQPDPDEGVSTQKFELLLHVTIKDRPDDAAECLKKCLVDALTQCPDVAGMAVIADQEGSTVTKNNPPDGLQ